MVPQQALDDICIGILDFVVPNEIELSMAIGSKQVRHCVIHHTMEPIVVEPSFDIGDMRKPHQVTNERSNLKTFAF